MNYSDYIVFADESGDPNPASPDANYPVFVLNFCVFRKDEYAASVLPAVTAFKFEHFGHDSVVLHERDIRRRNPPFAFLDDGPTRCSFMDGLNALFAEMNVNIISAVINKRRLIDENGGSPDLYQLALRLCLEQVHEFLESRGHGDQITHVVIESRGRREDAEVQRELFRDQSATHGSYRLVSGFDIVFADKKTNSPGMQIADLTAGPIGRHFIRPEQSNRAWDVLEPKLFRDPRSGESELGLVVYPE